MDTTTAPPPPAASKRYDRQLRVWGPQGQEALGRTRVAVLGSGPAASEALKNLVLGGIGSFVVVDDAVVSGVVWEREEKEKEREKRSQRHSFSSLAIIIDRSKQRKSKKKKTQPPPRPPR